MTLILLPAWKVIIGPARAHENRQLEKRHDVQTALKENLDLRLGEIFYFKDFIL